MSPIDVCLAIFVQVLWGGVLTLAKPLVGQLPPILLMAVSYSLAGLVLFPVAPRLRTRPRHLVVISLTAGTIQAAMLLSGLKLLPASMAMLILQLQIPFAALLSWIVGRDKPSLRNWIGMALVLIGIAVVIGRPSGEGRLLGILLVGFSGAFWASGQVGIAVWSRDSGLAVYAGLLRYAAPQLWLTSLVFEGNPVPALQSIGAESWIAILILAFLGCVLPYALWYRLLMRYRVDEVMPFSVLMPVVGVILSIVELGEPITEGLIIGGGILTVGLAVIAFGGRVFRRFASAVSR
ncbi:MAG TPA: EamA family transporter [Dongiaceae bacterium]|nr:EamA family transporter [Dongiaceae bacterium]